MITYKELERIKNAAWLVEDNQIVNQLRSAYRMYNYYMKRGDSKNAAWEQAYYWALRRGISKRWR